VEKGRRMIKRKRRCRSVILFSDDFAENPCTFRCLLKEGHKGDHTEGGNQWGKKYCLRWKRRKKGEK